jgi:NADPH-dependent 2,4-dienoyl-CoA reductase/sulfur reductase-like enzyme
VSPAKIVLIGGGVTSHEAAKQIRRVDDEASITLVSDEPHRPYNRPPLSKEFLCGDEQRENLYLSPEAFYRESRIDGILGVRAESIDRANGTVTLSNGRRLEYHKLLIATGASPIRPGLPGIDRRGVHTLRTIEDAEAIAAEALSGKRAVVVGAGFVGLEVAATLAQRGVAVTSVEAMPQIWPRFAGPELASHFQGYCEQRGIEFRLGDGVEEILGGERVSGVKTRSGEDLPCDFVVVGVGVRPNVALAESAGLPVENGIVVDEQMRTADPDIYAAGDVASYFDPTFDLRRQVEHWGHAEYSGQVAGLNMAGQETAYDLLTYVWSDIFDLHLEFAGDESGHDETVVRGSLDSNEFIVLTLKDRMLRSYFSVNTPAREFPVFQRLIKRKTDLTGRSAELADPTFNVRGLL